MLTVLTHTERLTNCPALQAWNVDNGELTIVDTDHLITSEISGFDFRDIDKTFTYNGEASDYEYIISGYISPTDNKYYMNNLKIRTMGDDQWDVFYRIQKSFGDDKGYVLTSAIIGYLIADNSIVGVDHNNLAVIGSYNGQQFVDSVHNLYCRDTVTRWGHQLRILVPETELSPNEMKNNLSKKSDTERTKEYMDFKQGAVNIFLIDRMIEHFWNGLIVDPSIVLFEEEVSGPPPMSSLNSWILPCVIEEKKHLLPLIDLATKSS